MQRWRQSFLLGLLAITIVIAALEYYIDNIPKLQMAQGQWVVHTHEVLNHLELLSEQLNRAEALAAGRATREEEDIRQSLKTIETLTQDNPNQQARLSTLHPMIETRLGRAMHPHSSRSAEQNKAESDAIAQSIEIMRGEENHLLEERLARWHKALLQTRVIFIGGSAFVYLLLLFLYLIVQKEARARERLLSLEKDAAALHKTMTDRLSEVIAILQEIVHQRLHLDKAMQVITERTQAITHASGAVVEMLEGDEMVYRAASGTMKPFIGLRIKAKGSLSGLCVATENILRCDDSESDERVDKLACRKVGLRSMIVVPLIQQNQPVGVLKVTSAQPNSFTTEDVGTLQLMAGMLSATLRDAVATDTLSKDNARLVSDKVLLETLATSDGMTGLKNHLYFQERLTEECLRAQRYNNALCVVMIDVDYFKPFNDAFGHPAGDEVLKQVATLLKNCARPSDCVARYGGEEFVIILPQTPLEGALRTAERMRQAVKNATWPHRAITISIGISGLENGVTMPATLIEQADKALYESKICGRDKISLFSKKAL